MDYDTLKSDIRARWNVTTNDAPNTLIDSWVNVAEPDVWREVRITANRARGLLGAVSGNLYAWVLPSTWTAIINVKADEEQHTRGSLDAVQRRIKNQQAYEKLWAIDGNGNVLITTPSVTDLEVTGYYRLSGLASGDTAAETALPAVYDAYFYRSMAEAADHYEHAERFDRYMNKFTRAAARINEAETTLI